jgi:hypothetical protein
MSLDGAVRALAGEATPPDLRRGHPPDAGAPEQRPTAGAHHLVEA